MKKKITFLIFTVLTVLCVVYSGMVLATGSGPSFFLVWIGLAVLSFLFGYSIWKSFWKKVPRLVKGICIAVVAVGFTAFFFVEGCIISQMHENGEAGLDYIIVLGAQVRESGPSAALKYRLDEAVEYLEDNPKTICIVSGGQGANEPYSEAEGMAQYLKEQGIDASRILLEDKSLNTEQNMEYSKALIKDGASVGIITNDFHLFRAKQIARKYGLDNVCGIAAKSTPVYLPNNMLREFLAEIKFLL